MKGMKVFGEIKLVVFLPQKIYDGMLNDSIDKLSNLLNDTGDRLASTLQNKLDEHCWSDAKVRHIDALADESSDFCNKTMERTFAAGEAIDVRAFSNGQVSEVRGMEQTELLFQLPCFVEGQDYFDRKTERWIQSIGRGKENGNILAATDNRFYQNPSYDCLWLR